MAVVLTGVAVSGVGASTSTKSLAGHRAKAHPAILRIAAPPHSSPATPSAAVSLAPPVTTTTSTTVPSAPTTTSVTTATPPTTTSETSRPPATAPAPTNGIVQAAGVHLTLNGSNYHFTGVNAYEAATDWGVNAGCGPQLSNAQLNQLFSSLPPNSMVRFWAFQGAMATNISTHQLDWAPLDRIFAAAAAHGQRLIVAITDQAGTCDGGHWQDPSWYLGGFRQVFNDPSTSDGRGLTPLSYWTVHAGHRQPLCKLTGTRDVGTHLRGGGVHMSSPVRAPQLRWPSDLPQRDGCRPGAPLLLQYGRGGDPCSRPSAPGRERSLGWQSMRHAGIGLPVRLGQSRNQRAVRITTTTVQRPLGETSGTGWLCASVNRLR